MEISALTRLRMELESFKLLTTANMIGAALTMAFTTAIGADKLIPLITGEPLRATQLHFLVIVISGFATAISWITRSAELMDEHDDISTRLGEIDDLPEDERDEEIIGVIVRSLAFYRENSEKIARLKWGGRLTGSFLIISGLMQLVNLLGNTTPFKGWYLAAQLFALVSSLAISAAAWYVPVVIERFMRTWDARLNLADDAAERLGRILEGDG